MRLHSLLLLPIALTFTGCGIGPHNALPYSNACLGLGEAVSGGNLNNFVGYTYDTATAAIFIAQNPGANVSSLFTLPTPQAPFDPILTSQPNDFTLSIVFTGGGITTPTAVANDTLGDLWIADANNTLEALNPLGVPISGSPFTDPSISNPLDIAVDSSNNVWLTNLSSNSVSQFSSTGTFSFKTGFSYQPAGLSIDPSGNAWIPNANGYDSGVLTEVSPSGTATSVLTGLNFPQNSVIDLFGNLWFNSVNSIGVTEYNSTGSLAIDSSGNLWGLNFDTSLVGINSSGSALDGIPFNTGSSNTENAFALDGQSSFWIASNLPDFSGLNPVFTSYLTAVSSTGSTLLNTVIPTPPSTGPFPESVDIHSLAIDSSGDIWLPAGNQIVEFIGIATPIETPMAQAIADYCIAQRPCVLPPL